MAPMKLLFLTHPYPNYVPDLLLHGLRKTLGPDAVDYPRKDCLYDGVLGLGVCPPNQLCPGWFPADAGDIDRGDVLAKLKRGYFDLVVADWRATLDPKPDLTRAANRLVLIDGEDQPARIAPGNYLVCRRETDGSDHSIPLPMALPEEILNWIVSYDSLPKAYSIGFLGSTHDGARRGIVETLSHRYTSCLFSASVVPSADNPFPEGRHGRDEYYRELQKCRVVLSLPGAGYDTFRFWENSACNAVHVAQRMPLYLPNDFQERVSILRFSGTEEIRIHLDAVLSGRIAEQEVIAEGRLNLYRYHLTTQRARYFLDQVTKAFQIPR
jgi:hypothetical protein